MAQFITVRIHSVQPDVLILSLPDGQQLTWPLNQSDKLERTSFTVGDEYILTLTSSIDVINELLEQKQPKHGDTTEQKTAQKKE
ncbi:MAG: hypothetical protein HYV32_03820 [Candidatus Kerfeldbacteria bacterium]|nr:hypothetical protein [Candidatus Kerfeldbacteria bacterium]